MGRHSRPGPGGSFGEEPADDNPTGRFARSGEDVPDTPDVDDDTGSSPLTDTARRRIAFEGGHRNESSRRGVSLGVIVALITVVVVVGGVILWRFFGDALSHRSTDAAQKCLGGTLNVGVVADPSIVTEVNKFAQGFNATVTPVGDRCVKMVVTSADSDRVVDGFVANWPGDLGERPALWIPASSIGTARLQSTAGKEIVSDARSLVSSPVVLAVRPKLKEALGQQNWSALPGLQSNPTALDGLNLPGWGSLRLALPTVGNADATFLAAEAVASSTAPPNSSPTAGLGAVNSLIAGQPKLADNTADTAWKELLSSSDAAGAPVHAVMTTEQQLFTRSSSTQDAKNSVAEWLPQGPVAVADYPTVLLAGNWLSEEQVSAASQFARFMRKPEQLSVLAKAGFRAEGTTSSGNDVVSFPQLGSPLTIDDESVRATLAAAVSTPATGATTTIMLNQAMSADEGGKSRLANVVTALTDRIGALPPNAAVGLWTFNGTEGKSAVPLGPVSDQSAALTNTLGGLSPSGSGAVSFTTLRLAYGEALANFRQGQANSLLVITQGPHTDQTLDGPGLIQYVKSAADPAKPVAINVIDFGDDSDRATWEAVAQASGGTYQNVATSDSPDLATAVSTLLT